MLYISRAIVPLLVVGILPFSHLTQAAEIGLPAINEAQQSCLLEPSIEVELSSEVQGVVRQMSVTRGDKVKKGDVLMILNSEVEEAVLATARAKVNFAARKVKRNQKLFNKKLLSAHEKDEMLTELRLAQSQAKEAKVHLKQRQTSSPIDGVIVEKLKELGEYVDESPFLRIVTLNPLRAEVVLQAEVYAQISKGMKVAIYPESDDQQAYHGEIDIIDPVIDVGSNTFAVSVVLENNERTLLAGLRCRVEF
ncbi:MAG: efflux RND transporter periplasmic adaptor subunit [Oceanospirillaceae bacterium]